VTLLLDGVLALGQGVPQLDGLVAGSRNDLFKIANALKSTLTIRCAWLSFNHSELFLFHFSLDKTFKVWYSYLHS
jgi:hypothetical protein